MDLTPYIRWIVFLHVAGTFVFVAGHGVSMFVAFQLRKERDRARLASLLDLSGLSLGTAGIGLLVLFLSGILAGIVRGSFDKAWIWIALVLFIVIALVMRPVSVASAPQTIRLVPMNFRALHSSMSIVPGI